MAIRLKVNVLFLSFLKCLSEIKKNLHKHCSNIENIVDEISYSLNPIQIGKFLLTLEKERNRKEFSVEKLWFGYQIEQVPTLTIINHGFLL